MKRLIFINLICIISFFCLFQPAFCLPWPPEVDLVQIKFNYYAGTYYDAYTLKTNNSTYVHVPEWTGDGNWNEKIAYNKNQSNRKIKAKFWIECNNIDFIRVYADKISGQGIGDIPNSRIDFNGSQYSQEEVLTSNGSVQSTIGIRNFTWRWYVISIDGTPIEDLLIGNSGPHEYYTLLQGPLSPAAAPWTDMLDLICVWAAGQTTESGAIEEITTNAYSHFGQTKHYWGGSSHAGGTSFNLTGFLNDYWGDCRDMSALVHIFTYWLGGANNRVRWIDDPYDPEEGFYYNPINPFGWPYNGHPEWTEEGEWWNFHQVAQISGVYDACLRLNENNPWISVGANIYGAYKNDLFDSGTWNPMFAFSYTYVY